MTRQEFLQILPELVREYRPAPEVLSKINNLNLLMVVGPTGVGKTSIIDQTGLKYVPSDTTRSPRPEEKEGVDFHFLTDYDQIVDWFKKGHFVQVAVDSGGDLKSTRASSYPDSGMIVMAIVTDVVPLMRKLGFKDTTSVFIVPPSYDEWMRRIASHNFSKQQLAHRLAEAKRSLNFALNDDEMHFILADSVEPAVQQIKELLNGRIDPEREAKARQAAQALLDGIN